jgi:hypothetical protein
MEAEIVVVTGDVPMGISAADARGNMYPLVGLTNDVSLRGLIPDELAKGFGFFQSKPASAFLTRIRNARCAGQPLGRRKAARRLCSRPERCKPFGPRRCRGRHDIRFWPA